MIFFFLIPQRKRGQILIFKNVTVFVRVLCKLQLSKLLFVCDLSVKEEVEGRWFCFGILVKGKFVDNSDIGVAH